ncbi:MAG: hypothetical protein JXR07_19880 [Reichenbachiella sp.]
MEHKMKIAMNIKSYIALVVLLSLFGCAKEDLSSIPPSEIFVKYYGSEKEDEIIDMVQIQGTNQYLILGTRASEIGESDMLLMLTDSAGNRLWEVQRDFTDDGDGEQSVEAPSSLFLLEDDNSQGWVIGTAYLGEVKEKAFVIRFDMSDGTITNETSFQYLDNRNLDNDPTFDTVYVETRGGGMVEVNGDFILVGSVKTGKDERSEANNYTVYMTSVAHDANYDMDTVSNWIQFDGNDSGNDHGLKLIEDNNEFFYLASIEDPLDGNNQKVKIKWFDPTDGNELAPSREFGEPALDNIPTSIISDENSLYVTGTTGDDNSRAQRAFFLRIDKGLISNGSFQLLDLVGSADGSLSTNDEGNKGFDLVKLDDGNFYVLGALKSHTDENNVLKQDEVVLTKVNGDGDIIGESVQIYGSDVDDEGKAIWLNADGSLLLGCTMGFGGDAKMMTLIKTNSQGELR